MSYAMQKGLIKPHQYSGYGAGHYQGFLTCGNIWLPRTSRLAKCPEMKKQFEVYQKNKQLRNSKGSWPYCGKKLKKYITAMHDAEQKGKDAWKMCKVGVEESELAEESFSITALDTPMYMMEGSTMSQPGAVAPSYVDYGPVDVVPPATTPATGMEDANRKLMLYGGIAAGGLLLLLLLRR